MIINNGEICDRCGEKSKPYCVSEAVWEAMTDNTKENSLCTECVSLRLGRPLSKRDLRQNVILNKKKARRHYFVRTFL